MSSDRAILIVDADGGLVEASVPELETRGYHIYRASDGGGALWILRRVAIDLILLDRCVEDADELLAARAADPDLAQIRLVMVTVGAGEAHVHGSEEHVVPSMH
jgi:DNA-binding response OmpR family regulator